MTIKSGYGIPVRGRESFKITKDGLSHNTSFESEVTDPTNHKEKLPIYYDAKLSKKQYLKIRRLIERALK